MFIEVKVVESGDSNDDECVEQETSEFKHNIRAAYLRQLGGLRTNEIESDLCIREFLKIFLETMSKYKSNLINNSISRCDIVYAIHDRCDEKIFYFFRWVLVL